VTVVEASPTRGGTRTAELTLPGFRHDVWAAVLPLVVLGGTQDLVQLLGRSIAALNPYATPAPRLYAARAALQAR
jgi:phytoene dehydrogenase-like protein